MVPPGQIVSLIGQNGAGKTSLLKIIAGLARPSRGSVTVFRQRLGFMPEQPAFLPTVSGWQWLVLTAGLLDLTRAQSHQEASEWLQTVGLWSARHQPIGTYSKGMRQRLAFAQAALGHPQLLLLDEPLDGLDPIGRQDLKRLILAARDRGATVILCSHILADIAELSDRLGVLDQGRLRYFGDTAQFHNGQDLETTFVNFLRHVPA
jgi:ABC-type multidrug transport system ATPase subunit